MSSMTVGKADSPSQIYLPENTLSREKSYHNFVPGLFHFAEYAWDRFKTLFIGEAKETIYLQELLQLDKINWENEKQAIAKILSAASPYGVQGHLLKAVLKRCGPDELQEILQLCFDRLFEGAGEDYLNILRFVGSKALRQSPRFDKLMKDIKEMAECMPQQIAPCEPGMDAEMKRTFSVVWRFFPNFMDTILKSFNLIEAGKGPESIWDFAAMMEIYFKIFMIPHGVFVIVGAVVSVAWQLFLITGLIVLAGVVGICLYLKFRPCPNKLARARNLTEEAELGRLEPVIGRDAEIQKIGSYLGNMKDGIFSNILLVGEPGVGKTELVKGLAQQFKEKTIFAVNAPELSSGYSSPADIMRLMLLDIRGHEKEVVFFLDELGEAMKKNGKANLSGYLKPLLGADGVQIIAAVTAQEYKEQVAVDNAFAERFTKIEVKPTSKEVTLEILRERMRLKGKEIKFQEGIAESVYALTEKCLQPRNSVKLLDLAINRVSAFDIALFVPKKLQEARQLLKERQQAYKKAFESGMKEKGEIAKEIFALKEEILGMEEKSSKMKNLALKTRGLIARQRKFSETRDALLRDKVAGKELFFLHTVLLPWMEKKIKGELQMIEEIPMQVDQSLIKQLFEEGTIEVAK